MAGNRLTCRINCEHPHRDPHSACTLKCNPALRSTPLRLCLAQSRATKNPCSIRRQVNRARRVFLDIGLAADKPIFLAGEENDPQISSKCRLHRNQCSGRLDQTENTGEIVEGPRIEIKTIEVRAQDDSFSCISRRLEFGHDVGALSLRSCARGLKMYGWTLPAVLAEFSPSARGDAGCRQRMYLFEARHSRLPGSLPHIRFA